MGVVTGQVAKEKERKAKLNETHEDSDDERALTQQLLLGDDVHLPGISIDSDSNVAYVGGTVDQRDELTLKKLLFRSTRGQAIISTFTLEVSDEDVLRHDDFHKRLTGYTIMFHDNGVMRKTVMRCCQSFVVGDAVKQVIEVSPKTV